MIFLKNLLTRNNLLSDVDRRYRYTWKTVDIDNERNIQLNVIVVQSLLLLNV